MHFTLAPIKTDLQATIETQRARNARILPKKGLKCYYKKYATKAGFEVLKAKRAGRH